MLSGFLAITDPLTVYLQSIGMYFGDSIMISTIFGGVLVGVGVGLSSGGRSCLLFFLWSRYSEGKTH